MYFRSNLWSNMKRTEVAIGLVVRGGRVLVCQRKNEADFGGLWEFPGGKCEAGELPRQCVIRELREELGTEVEPVHALPAQEHDYPAVHVRLHPFLCMLTGGEPRPLESQRLEWADPAALPGYSFPAANRPIVDHLIALLSPTFAHPPAPPPPVAGISSGLT
jgi:8-oxo-dGTP diphosphatase